MLQQPGGNGVGAASALGGTGFCSTSPVGVGVGMGNGTPPLPILGQSDGSAFALNLGTSVCSPPYFQS